MDKLEIFNANETSMTLDRHQNQGYGWYRESSLSLPVMFLLIVPYTFLWIIFFYFVFVFAIFSFPCHAALWSPPGIGLTSWLSCI